MFLARVTTVGQEPAANVRLAIIGCGAATATLHLPALQAIGWRPAMLIDPDLGRAEAAAQPSGAAAAADLSALPDDITAAVIATPHHLHAPVACALLEKGIHVLVEKPIAETEADARRMLDSARRGGGSLFVGNQRRQFLGWRWAKTVIDDGRLGAIRHIAIEDGIPFNGKGVSLDFWRPGPDGGGAMFALGPHGIDLLLWWFGSPSSFAYRDNGQGGVETDAEIDFHLPSGAAGHLRFSQVRRLSRTARVVGTDGEMVVDLYDGRVAVRGARCGMPPGPELLVAASARQMRLWRAALADPEQGRDLVGGEAGLRVLQFIRACYARRPSPRPAPARSPGRPVAVVTGATGFIGGRVVEKLVERGDLEVRAVVRSYDRCARLAHLPVPLHRGDYGAAAAMRPVLVGADCVIHAGFDPRASAGESVAATAALAEVAREAGVRRFIHIGCAAVGAADGDRPTKDLIDQEIDRQVARGLPAIILQPGIVYGPFGATWTHRPIERLATGCVVIPVETDGGWCNAVHVDDLVQAIQLAAAAPDPAIGERFIITGPDPTTWSDFYARHAAMIGRGRILGLSPEAVMTRLARQAAVAQMTRPVNWIKAALWKVLGQARVVRIRAVVKTSFAPDRVHLPDLTEIALYRTRVRLESAKAMTQLGYRPAYDLERGLENVAAYVRWAFPTLVQSGRP